MGYIYSGSNTTSPIGKVMDYNNTNPSKGVAVYRLLSVNSPSSATVSSRSESVSDFSQAIYAKGPYSLLHPNSTTDDVAKRLDLLA